MSIMPPSFQFSTFAERDLPGSGALAVRMQRDDLVNKKDLFQRASRMDEEAILILKQNYLDIGEDLLEMLEYLDSVALDARTYLLVESFLEGLCNTPLLTSGLKVAIEKNPAMAVKICEEINLWDLSYEQIEDVLYLVDDRYKTLLEQEQDCDENHIEDRKSLGDIVSHFSTYLRDEGLSVPELKNFCEPRKRVRVRVSLNSDSE